LAIPPNKNTKSINFEDFESSPLTGQSAPPYARLPTPPRAAKGNDELIRDASCGNARNCQGARGNIISRYILIIAIYRMFVFGENTPISGRARNNYFVNYCNTALSHKR
jgi:hypothetical protein